MKTFEERYTAWIDGQLAGDALASFEQELARRAETGDADAAETDKSQALQLRSLLKEHLRAPALTNTEFFNHQMRERIDTEADRASRRRESAVRPAWRFPAFAWPFGRVAAAGAACLFVAGALYYGMVPAHGPDAKNQVADASPSPSKTTAGTVAAAGSPATQAPAVERAGDNQFAINKAPTPAPVDLSSTDDIRIAPSTEGSTTSATPLHHGNAGVIWVTGLPYLPSISTPNPSPDPSTTPGVMP